MNTEIKKILDNFETIDLGNLNEIENMDFYELGLYLQQLNLLETSYDNLKEMGEKSARNSINKWTN